MYDDPDDPDIPRPPPTVRGPPKSYTKHVPPSSTHTPAPGPSRPPPRPRGPEAMTHPGRVPPPPSTHHSTHSSAPRHPPSTHHAKPMSEYVKPRNKYYDVCNNCGKQGHTFKQCKNPITSFGVIIFRINQERQREYLMIRRKDTLGYIDFMRGKYSVSNHKYILNMFKQMTAVEKAKLATYTFDELWKDLWESDRMAYDAEDPDDPTKPPSPREPPPGLAPVTPVTPAPTTPAPTSTPTTTTNTVYHQEETNSREKFHYLSTKLMTQGRPGVPLSRRTPQLLGRPGEEPTDIGEHPIITRQSATDQTILQYLLMVSNIPEIWRCNADPTPPDGEGWAEPEWGFPKGRRNFQEKDYECALREMMEETGYAAHHVKNIKNILPFDEIFLGSNYKSYKHRYYLMYMNYHDSLATDNFEKSEVSRMEWKTYEECMKSIRGYNLEKKRLITNIEMTLSKYRLYI